MYKYTIQIEFLAEQDLPDQRMHMAWVNMLEKFGYSPYGEEFNPWPHEDNDEPSCDAIITIVNKEAYEN